MKTTHTPAPWYCLEFAGSFLIQDGEYYEDGNILDSDYVGMEQAKANAKLAAAAPELLESLISAKNLIGSYRLKKDPPSQEIWEQIESVIKKATE